MDVSWLWSFGLRREFFEWEENNLLELYNALSSVCILDCEDRCIWKLVKSGKYSAKIACQFLNSKVLGSRELSDVEEKAYKILWKSLAPSEVVTFCLQLLLDRIPTKSNMFCRKVIVHVNETFCAFVVNFQDHHCTYFVTISALPWSSMVFWIGWVWLCLFHMVYFFFFFQFCSPAHGSWEKKAWALIWNAVMWSIWELWRWFVVKSDCSSFLFFRIGALILKLILVVWLSSNWFTTVSWRCCLCMHIWRWFVELLL